MVNLIGFPSARLQELMAEWNEKPYRADQIFTWVYHQKTVDFDAMTNLSKSLRQHLKDYFHMGFPRIAQKTVSADGTIKYLFQLEDGENIEAVWIPDNRRKTLCISTQVGCRLGCSFCLTATLGLKRNLTPSEILGQYMAVNRDLPETEQVTNVVVMGMGEPLDNYDSLVAALRLMVSPEGLRISNRRITLSTSGLVDKIKKFQAENIMVNLAVSLNATEDATRSKIMPIDKKYPIAVLLDCLRDYPLKRKRRLTFEYVLLRGTNDSHEDAVRLARLLKGIPCKVNLIPFNRFEGADYEAPSEEALLDFQNYLISKNYTVFIRKPRGADILGACGQLAAQSLPQAIPQ
ncbi:MAG: 23S rRNA (adenine(2503)-C(2))-methyltransferase RlmN [Nitrospinae bacterium]|nr:23S rRNA (adenine(2503)-C(2))-methyltransferase RlmN [Nitrospinota bacterium]